MTYKIDWNFVLLKENPFYITPPTDPYGVVWAGMSRVKQKFNEIFEEGLSSSITQVVLNRGPFGGGKTHASLYFSREENLPNIANDKTRQVYPIRISTPKETGKPDEDFYTDLLEKLGMTKIREVVSTAIKEREEKETHKFLQNVLGSEELTHAFWLLGIEKSDEKQGLLRAYFLDSCTRTELRKLSIARNITKAQDRFRVAAGVLQCLIGLDPSLHPSRHSRVCLWIDEMEDLVYFTSAQFRTLTQGIRELIDLLPNFFTLFMNFTLTEPEEYEEIEVVLGKALMDRITNVIYFPELTLDEAIQYIQELMNNSKFRGEQPETKGLPSTYPFEKNALKNLLEDLDKRTPRNINKRCRNIINFAFRDNIFPSPGKGIIDILYVKRFEQSQLDREI